MVSPDGDPILKFLLNVFFRSTSGFISGLLSLSMPVIILVIEKMFVFNKKTQLIFYKRAKDSEILMFDD